MGMGKIEVISVRGMKVGSDKDVIYVGRRCSGWEGSVLGNKYKVGVDGERGECVELYKEWLREEWRKGGVVKEELLRIGRIVKSGENVKLGCWCKGRYEKCHGDFVKYVVEVLIEKGYV